MPWVLIRLKVSPVLNKHSGFSSVAGCFLFRVVMSVLCANVCLSMMVPEIVRVSNIRRQHGAGDFERFPITSPNQMLPSPPIQNFCGNGFSPWNGMHSEVIRWLSTVHFSHQTFLFAWWHELLKPFYKKRMLYRRYFFFAGI